METNEVRTIFSNNLNYWLNRRGKTQADLYRRLDVSSATSSDWCNAKKVPRAEKLFVIASWLMIEISDLLSINNHETDEVNDLIFRIRDDDKFRNLVSDISKFDDINLVKLVNYIELLKRQNLKAST